MRWRRLLACSALTAAVVIIAVGCHPNPEDAIRSGRISISTSPENGALVKMGGEIVGETPFMLAGLRYGRYLLIIEKDGYRRATRVIEVADSSDQTIAIALERVVGYVTVETKPSGAKVYIDGKDCIGETPIYRAPLAIGKHTYEVRLDNYKTLTHECDIQQDYRYTLAHDLIPREAALSIFSRPTNAKIMLNNEPVLETTPAKLELSPGTYEVRVSSKGYIGSEQMVVLKANEEKTLEFVMKEGHVPSGMVLIPAGKFIMGLDGASPDERPQRVIGLDAFYIDKFEVTNQQFKAVFPSHTFVPEAAQHPVTNVTWKQATEYAQAVGKRLPTEEEWEKAARGTDGWEYPWGMEFKKEYCNAASPTRGVMRVGTFKLGGSPFNLMDMAGNAYEWTSSWYQAYPGNTDIKKDYGQVFRVLRGGSYASDRFGVRCARRHFDRVDYARPDYGFRCAKDVAQP
ncbi:MAG TPA: SUMF1/EgtB/PvdO family nonheme iron enzyme [Candidatus Bathyarchaeia archaeon]|nr:SUMF1/EgtB/PvdO family nonheme iron enzyme [Candidatus Bathyarchaeia archaeon]